MGHWEPGWAPPQSWLVTDVQELTVGAAATVTVEVPANGLCFRQGRGRVGRWGAKGLGRLRPGRAGECMVAIGVAVYAVREGLLLENVVV